MNYSDHEYLPVDALAAAFKVSKARIYRLAYDGLWRRRRINGRTCYLIHDAADTLETSKRLTNTG